MRVSPSVALLILLVTVAGCARKPTLDERIAEQESIAKQLGWKLLPSQIAADMKVDPKQNAALDIKALLRVVLNPDRPNAAEHFQAGFKPEVKRHFVVLSALFANSNQVKRASIEALRSEVKAMSPFLDQFAAATAKPKWDFNRKLGKAYAVLYPDLAAYKNLCKMLAARAYVRAIDGDKRAVDDVRALRRFSKLLFSEPTLLSVLVGCGVDSITAKGVQLIAQACPQNKQLIGSLAKLYQEPMPSIDYRKIWCLEVASDLVNIDFVATDVGMKVLGGGLPVDQRMLKPTRLELLRIGNDALKAWKGSYNDIDVALAVLGKPSVAQDHLLRSYHSLLGSSDPSLGRIGSALKSIKRTGAKLQLTYLMLRMVELGSYKGHPMLPSEATEKRWFDPYSKKPMMVMSVVNGFKVYSVGENGVDDLGQEDPSGANNFDIAVTYKSRQ